MIEVGDLVTVREIDTIGIVVATYTDNVVNVLFDNRTHSLHKRRLTKLGEQK
jgi:hypothetical protein